MQLVMKYSYLKSLHVYSVVIRVGAVYFCLPFMICSKYCQETFFLSCFWLGMANKSWTENFSSKIGLNLWAVAFGE